MMICSSGQTNATMMMLKWTTGQPAGPPPSQFWLPLGLKAPLCSTRMRAPTMSKLKMVTAPSGLEPWPRKARYLFPVPYGKPGRTHLLPATVQTAECWGVMLALQAFSGILVGIDNLNVLGGVATLIDQYITGAPLPSIKDGDLLAVIHSMITLRGEGAVEFFKVKGHAVQAVVDNSRRPDWE